MILNSLIGYFWRRIEINNILIQIKILKVLIEEGITSEGIKVIKI